jgi:hypothetical protein
MPAYTAMKVIVEVEFEIRGPRGYEDAVAQAVKPVEAISGAKIKAVHVEKK